MSLEQRLAMNAERAARGEPHYPAGALKLGCGGCRPRDMSLPGATGEPLYCAVCPVARRQRERLAAAARAAGESTYRWGSTEWLA